MTGLYVHVPFCARACPYCDFDFRVGRRPAVAEWIAGLDRELVVRRSELVDLVVNTIYVGGGTPSLLGAADLATFLEWLDHGFSRHQVAEFTVEMNPEHVDGERLRVLADHGVDRVSLGIQTFDGGGLRQLGRAHDPIVAGTAIEAVVAGGFRASIDLIVGWPGQGVADVERDVARIVELGPDHLSVYALTIEEGTPWPALVRRGRRSMPDPDRQATLLEAASSALRGAGFRHYEIASWARNRHARSMHNEGYWTWRDYVGLGPSAHSARYDSKGAVTRRGNVRGLDAWLKSPQAAIAERLVGPLAAAEGLWLGLRRLEDGVSLEGFLARFPAVDRSWVERRVAKLVAGGSLVWCEGGDRIRVADQKWLVYDRIAAELVAWNEVADSAVAARIATIGADGHPRS